MTRQTGLALLRPDEFARHMIGVPWANRACTFHQCDCWGLVVLYYRHVAGKEIHHSPGYEAECDFHTCFTDEVVFWRQSEHPQEGCIFIAYEGSQKSHVGLVVNGRALHSRGESGAVRSDRLAAIEKIFTRVEYMVYAAD